MGSLPPNEVAVGMVSIRRWRAEDAEVLHRLILDNLDHLRPWMAWAKAEPVSLEQREAKVERWCRSWDAGEDFAYAIIGVEGDLLGGCGLRRQLGDTCSFEIGYWVRQDRTGTGVATDAVRALVEAAFAVDGVSHVEIHHDVANLASERVPLKAGFRQIGRRAVDRAAPSEVGVDVLWRLDRSDSSTARWGSEEPRES